MNHITSNDPQIKLPLISVIVPVYKVEEHLPKCMDSILNQSYIHLDIILVDDGSPDNCGIICDDYARKDKRVSVIHQKNTGLSGARNSGLEIAKGEYICFVDSDDWIENNMLLTLLNFAINNKLDVVECGSIQSIDYRTNEKIRDFISGQIETPEEALARIIKNQSFSVWRRIYHKEIIGNLKFIPNKISEDVFFTIDILKKIDRHGYIETPLYIYNVENISIVRSPYNQKKLDSIDAVFYVIDETKDFNDEVKNIAKKHVIQQLMSPGSGL
jgi:GT2 family glycosyltransferase